MKPKVYCAKVTYKQGTYVSDTDYVIDRVLLKDNSIRYMGNSCFLFQTKDMIPEVFEKVYREFAHIKDIIESIEVMHVSDIDDCNLEVLFEKSSLH